MHGVFGMAKKPPPPVAPPPKKARREYRSAVLEDQRYAKKMVLGQQAPRRQRATEAEMEEIPDPSTGLPPAAFSELSKGLESWCLRGSWGLDVLDVCAPA